MSLFYASYDYIVDTETAAEDFNFIFSKMVPGTTGNQTTGVDWKNKAKDTPAAISSQQIIQNLFSLLPKQMIEDAMFHYRKDYEAFGYDFLSSIDKLLAKQTLNKILK